jgi:hypothetical protein
MSFVISSGTRSSPLTRRVANALTASVARDLVVDVSDVLAIFIRQPTVVVYNGSIRSTKVADVELHPSDAELIAHIAGRVAGTVPNNRAHGRPPFALVVLLFGIATSCLRDVDPVRSVRGHVLRGTLAKPRLTILEPATCSARAENCTCKSADIVVGTRSPPTLVPISKAISANTVIKRCLPDIPRRGSPVVPDRRGTQGLVLRTFRPR